VDSIKASYAQVALVDGGGFFPEDDLHLDGSWFLMDMMKVMGMDAVGMSEKELRFGLGYLRAQVKRTQLPMTCANLYEFDSKTGKRGRTVFAPSIVKTIGSTKVGFFSLMSGVVDLGSARDSMKVEDPTAAAKRTVAELKKKGATVIVLLSQLGKVEGEDLVTAVDGIDAVILGHNVPLLQKGRLIKNTVACYGGEQGQYIGRTLLNLDASRHSIGGDNETFILGPDVPDKKEVATLVKAFNDSFNEKLQRLQKEKAAKDAEKAASGGADHYMGKDVCVRCHPAEAAQWRTTKHAQAWQTLVKTHKDTDPSCVACHVVGKGQPGGYKDQATTANMTDVQCESCHGMGSQHDALKAAPRKITEQTCRVCHDKNADPSFSMDVYLPYVMHKDTGAPKQPLPPSPMQKYLTAGPSK
jgi:hypothetical protein